MGLLDIFNVTKAQQATPAEDQGTKRKSKDIDDKSIRVQLFRFMNSIELYKIAVTNFENTVFPTNEELIRVYNDVVLDSHVFALMEARKQKVLSKDFKVVDEDGEELTEETDLLTSTWFMDSLNLALDSIFYGFSLIQLGDREGLGFKGVKVVPREYVYPQKQIVRDTPTSNTGTPYTTGVYAPWLIPAGRPEDLGVLSKVAPMQIYKKAALGSWAMFTAIFGNPLRIGRTNVRDEKLRNNMAAMLEQMDVATYGVFDHEDTVEFVQAAKTDAYNVFDKAIERCNSEISKAVIGATMITDEGSSRSQSEVHERTAAAFVKKDAMYLQYWVNKVFIPHLNSYHGFNISGRWTFDETEVLSVAEQFERDIKLAELYDLPAEYIREQYGVPVQDKNDDSLDPGDIENALSLGKYTPLEGAIKDFYKICCNQDVQLPADGDDFRVITKQQEEELYKGIYSGEYNPGSLPVELYVGTGEALSDGIEQGLNEYNKLGLGYVPDQGFFDALRDNAYKFSAAKTYQQVLDMSSYLVDPETGEQVSFSKFKKQAAETFGTYNKNYLRAEYNNAFNGSQMASKWQDAVESAEDFPYLKYWTANDLRVRKDHKELDDIIQPIGSDFWAKYYPPNGWNCRCTVVKVTDLDEPTKLGRRKLPELPTEFENNVGQTRQIYSPEHPYFVVAPQYTPALQALPQPAPREYEAKNTDYVTLKGYQGEWKKHELNDYGQAAKFKLKDTFKTELPDAYLKAATDTKNSVTSRNLLIGNVDKSNGSYYAPYANYVQLRGSWVNYGVETKRRVTAHEVGHAIHNNKRLIEDGKPASQGFLNFKKALKDEIEDPAFKFSSSYGEFKKDKNYMFLDEGMKELEKEYRKDYREGRLNKAQYKTAIYDVIVVRDTIASLTKGKYGGGHDFSYYQDEDNSNAEIFAHLSTNYAIGNDIYKTYLPKSYEAGNKYLESIIGR